MSRSLRSLLPAALLAAACGKLDPDPGADFAVRVVGSSSITAVGKLSVPLRFTVSGCDAFDAAIRSGGSTQAIATARQADGTWYADVPVEWLRTEDRDCVHDALRPQETQAALVVTCRDGTRSATAGLEISYGTATRAYGPAYPLSDLRYFFPNTDPLVPDAMAVRWAEQGAQVLVGWDGRYEASLGGPLADGGIHYEAGPLVEPRLVATPGVQNIYVGNLVFSSGCQQWPACPDLPAGDATSVPSEALTWLGDGAASYGVWVPRYVIDLAMLDERTVLVLSQPVPFPHAGAPVSVLSVVTNPPGADAQPQVTILATFPGEWVQSRFRKLPDGRLAWLSWVIPGTDGPIRSVLRTTDGVAVEATPDPTGTADLGQLKWTLYSWVYGALSPDASEILLTGPKLVDADGTVTPLPTSESYVLGGGSGDGVWLDGAIAVWSGTYPVTGLGTAGRVEVFDAAPPHARRFGYTVEPLPGSGASAPLYGAEAVGDKLVLTTATGVRVLGPDGALLGGADPLPCGLSTTSRATRVGETTFAVGAGRYWYVFDLADP